MSAIKLYNGTPHPYGASLKKGGVNFSIFSRNGTAVSLHIFANEKDAVPTLTIPLNPKNNKTGDIWHVFVEGLKTNALYLYTVDGPFEPENGHRFNNKTYLLDPYAKALTNTSFFNSIPKGYSPVVTKEDIKTTTTLKADSFPKCVVIDDEEFDWQDDTPLNYPLQNTILYETHLKGFTKSATSKIKKKGTYKGLIEKIPYLKELGITSIELLPIHEFDEYENTNTNPKTGARLTNYWGYSTMSFFAPKTTYASNKNPGKSVTEFKEMVRELHKNGIEVILDIVFNHTAEGNENGHTLNFKGIDNSIYYILEDENKQWYKNYSGCGNTFNCNHPVVRTYIIDCLKYWVCEMHVDGFRFDLGSILGRDQNGNLMANPPMLERIAEEPVLRNTKIIAEAWDAAGAYQVGNFPGGRWAEWNDRFRDDFRHFWKGDQGYINEAATRLTGSSDLYLQNGRKPFHSINYLTSHDGFTLNDLVSYEKKRNEENGEENRDGANNNESSNYGFEGKTTNKKIEATRIQQIKNFIMTLFLSQGTPMLLCGDEFRNTQKGNNNSYCQDNDTSWINWDLKDQYKEIFEFTKKAIKFRLNHPALSRPEFFRGEDTSKNNMLDISWFNEHGKEFDWAGNNTVLACQIDGSKDEIINTDDDNDFYILLNASNTDTLVNIHSVERTKWYRVVDSAQAYPNDFLEEGKEIPLEENNTYIVKSKSIVIFIGK